MSTQRLNGTFSPNPFTGIAGRNVIGETLNSPSPALGWSPGAVRAVPIGIQPSLTERWSLLGFSMRCTAATVVTLGALPSPWGFLGDLWAGVLIDSAIQDAQAATLPQDLSTFTKLFDGENDTLAQAASANSNATGLLGTTYMFPTPLGVQSGTQLQMALILTPSLLSVANGNTFTIRVQSADYTLLYDDGRP